VDVGNVEYPASTPSSSAGGAGFKGPTCKRREGKGREGEREGKEWVRKKERGWRGKGIEGRGKHSPCSDFTI